MKIFKITSNFVNLDCNLEHVIVANKIKEVRLLAADNAADEGKNVWLSAKVEKVGDYTGDKTEPFILITNTLNS